MIVDGIDNDLGTRAAGQTAPPVPATPPRPPSRLVIGRRLWLAVHKYIGLFVGALFVVVGLTGSILAFWQAIDEWLNAGIMRVEVPPQAIYPPARRNFCRRQGGHAA